MYVSGMSSVFSGALIEDYLMNYLVATSKSSNGGNDEEMMEEGDETKEEELRRKGSYT